MWITRCSLAGLLLMAADVAAAQTPRPGSTGVVKPTIAGPVKPGSVVDPGMTVIHPRMPPASTPVIKPKSTTPDGSVVVPKSR